MKANTKFFYSFTVKETHLDTFEHMNNAAYLVLFEEARWECIHNNGYGIQRIKETGLGPTILQIEIRYLKEIKLREKIVIETEVSGYRRKICKLTQKMLRGEEVCCVAEFTMGLFCTQQRKLVLPTSEWLKAIGFSDL